MLEILLMTGKAVVAPSAGSAIFAGGNIAGAATSSTIRYKYSTGVYTSGGGLQLARRYFAGTGENTLGLLEGGYANINFGEKYIYSTDASLSATTLSLGRAYGAASGSTTLGFFYGGWSGSGNGVANVDVVNYSANTFAAGTSLSVARYGIAAAGNTARGVLRGGYTNAVSSVSESYVYSSGARTTLTSLSVGKAYSMAVSNVGFGYYAGGYNAGAGGYQSSTEKYNYSLDTTSAGNALKVARHQGGAAGNSDMGIISGGDTGVASAATDKINYSDDTVVASTVLTDARNGSTGVSSTPGGLGF